MFFLVIRIYEKLMINSDINKAASWARLTDEFLNSPLMNVDGVKVTLYCRETTRCKSAGDIFLCVMLNNILFYVNMSIFACRQMLIIAYCP